MLNNKLNLLLHYYGKLARENGIGYLEDSRGIKLPSFTSILKATKPPAEKAQLAKWRQKVGNFEANRITQESKQRVTLIHQQIKNYFLDEPIICPDFIKPYWHNLLPILENIHNIRLIEANLFHYYLGYSGRVDCVANYCNIPCVIEFKTAERIKHLYDEPLQLAAYCGAVNRQYGLRIKNTLVIVTTPDEAIVHWLEPKDVMKKWHQWENKVTEFWSNRGIFDKVSA
ncbi:MAG: exonuclease [Nostocales cyanobacterium]|nr:MAG: exonuclease [Nostocales cyanobacterium]